MDALTDKLQQLKTEATTSFAAGETIEALYEAKVRYLGKKGFLTDILKNIGQLPVNDRPVLGALANKVRGELEEIYSHRVSTIQENKIKATLASEKVDVTLPGFVPFTGHLHPVTQVLGEMKDIFRRMGFDIYEGPEIETDYYNFEALNIPENHPARDMQDTFYLSNLGGPLPVGRDTPQTPAPRTGKAGSSAYSESPLLLRTHTSPVQVRVMEKNRPPIHMVAPGVVYRRDSDVSHTPMFHQIEGLMVDQGITLGDLKGVLQTFLRQIFDPKIKVRFRPSYFPFTEPSAEVDIGCIFCSSVGAPLATPTQSCRICKGSGWLEIMGCGMVDPAVFKPMGIDSEVYTGFAFGIGIERVAMLKYKINDIRLFFENNLSFLRQF